MSLVQASQGSVSISHSTGGLAIGRPSESRDMIEARSNRKPSTCMSATQWCSASITIRRTTEWLAFRVFPQPV